MLPQPDVAVAASPGVAVPGAAGPDTAALDTARPDMAAPGGNGPEELRARIGGILNSIIDPCSAATACAAGIVDLGLIRELSLQPCEGGRWRCQVKLCVTHAFCMMTGIFVNEIERRLGSLESLAGVQVDLDCSTIWTEELMSPDYRRRLRELRGRRGIG